VNIPRSAWVVPAVAATLFAIVVATGSNRALFHALNGISHATGAAPWPYITILGDTAVAIALFLPFAMRRIDVLWALALSALLATLFVHGIKPLMSMPRPPAVLAADAITIIGPAHRGNAFPSGHTTTIFVAAGLVWLHVRPLSVRAIVLAVAVLVGLSRAVVGVHWPTDILAGAAGGWLCAIAGDAIARRSTLGRHPAMRALLLMLCTGSAVALLAGLSTGYPQAVTLQRAIGALGIAAVVVAALRRLDPPPLPGSTQP
jgi:membrane-associated phospholipid phosphatase